VYATAQWGNMKIGEIVRTVVKEARELKEYNNRGINETYEYFELSLYILGGAAIAIYFVFFAD
jgi:hypothetical protein